MQSDSSHDSFQKIIQDFADVLEKMNEFFLLFLQNMLLGEKKMVFNILINILF